jgi:hypothetical protein
MSTAAPLNELLAIEKLRERELEEARIIERSKLPARPLHEFGIVISREFQPVPKWAAITSITSSSPMAPSASISATSPARVCLQHEPGDSVLFVPKN